MASDSDLQLDSDVTPDANPTSAVETASNEPPVDEPAVSARVPVDFKPKKIRVWPWVVAVIVLGLLAVLVWIGVSRLPGMAPTTKVYDVQWNPAIVGSTVQVNGVVIGGTWNGGTDPAVFAIRGVANDASNECTVAYYGTPPAGFGAGAKVVVAGLVRERGLIESRDMGVQTK